VAWEDDQHRHLQHPIAGMVIVSRSGLGRRPASGSDRPTASVKGTVYAYSLDDYDSWSRIEGLSTTAGLFEENLTVIGLDLGRAVIGDRWAVGPSVLQVVQPSQRPPLSMARNCRSRCDRHKEGGAHRAVSVFGTARTSFRSVFACFVLTTMFVSHKGSSLISGTMVPDDMGESWLDGPSRHIVLLATPTAQSLEIAGPVEIFSTAVVKLREAGRELSLPYEVTLAACSDVLTIRSATSGLTITADCSWSNVRGEVDTVIVAGGMDVWTGADDPAAIGVAFGLAGAFGITRVIGTLLYNVTPTDPLSFGGVVAFLTLIAIVASYVPARRATTADPIVALRNE
jgi:hypothetical protein